MSLWFFYIFVKNWSLGKLCLSKLKLWSLSEKCCSRNLSRIEAWGNYVEKIDLSSIIDFHSKLLSFWGLRLSKYPTTQLGFDFKLVLFCYLWTFITHLYKIDGDQIKMSCRIKWPVLMVVYSVITSSPDLVDLLTATKHLSPTIDFDNNIGWLNEDKKDGGSRLITYNQTPHNSSDICSGIR